jgi:hypothetical protein
MTDRDWKYSQVRASDDFLVLVAARALIGFGAALTAGLKALVLWFSVLTFHPT